MLFSPLLPPELDIAIFKLVSFKPLTTLRGVSRAHKKYAEREIFRRFRGKRELLAVQVNAWHYHCHDIWRIVTPQGDGHDITSDLFETEEEETLAIGKAAERKEVVPTSFRLRFLPIIPPHISRLAAHLRSPSLHLFHECMAITTAPYLINEPGYFDPQQPPSNVDCWECEQSRRLDRDPEPDPFAFQMSPDIVQFGQSQQACRMLDCFADMLSQGNAILQAYVAGLRNRGYKFPSWLLSYLHPGNISLRRQWNVLPNVWCVEICEPRRVEVARPDNSRMFLIQPPPETAAFTAQESPHIAVSASARTTRNKHIPAHTMHYVVDARGEKVVVAAVIIDLGWADLFRLRMKGRYLNMPSPPHVDQFMHLLDAYSRARAIERFEE
ncbi:uncharacterized protein EV422DRAFT_544610 [Fimicolochytrium jonesii]|uniref:uncharacterized protein n=1 Tax=Fimicolochytrium jonesii TaxID=1396493 RepID=UPI0022FDE1BF|nr:uncharacterized protein EV422DRAFT_544610 [Fimicolochytrium jonesii]KAI8816732.1 hypothetical protein EV422DRAFT_544610 [Fimicolochytrium jonesii]